jgi:hypothetical protein
MKTKKCVLTSRDFIRSTVIKNYILYSGSQAKPKT